MYGDGVGPCHPADLMSQDNGRHTAGSQDELAAETDIGPEVGAGAGCPQLGDGRDATLWQAERAVDRL